MIKAAIAENQDEIGMWLKQSRNTRLELEHSSPATVGRSLVRGKPGSVDRRVATVILVKAKEGFYVLTAYVE